MHSIHVSAFCLIITLAAFKAETNLSYHDTSKNLSKSSSKTTHCEPVTQKVPGHGTIIWDVKLKYNNFYLSTPICLNEEFNYKVRTCTGHTFEEEFPCENIQKPISKCPIDSLEIEINGQTVCYTLTEPMQYSDLNCEYKNAASMSKFANNMAQFTNTEVWYPGSKIGPYNIFVHDELTENYRSIVEGVEYEGGTSEGKNCIKINSLGKKTAVSCNDQYVGLCIFKTLEDLQEYSYCRLENSDDKITSYINHYDLNKARCIFEIDSSSCNKENAEPAEYLEPFQSYVITYEYRTRYRTALQYNWNTRNGFYWATTNAPLTYGWWSTEVHPSSTDIYSIADGWTTLNSFTGPTALICQSKETITFEQVHLEINRDANDIFIRLKTNHLAFARIGSEPVFCFTDRAAGLPVSKVDLGRPTIENKELVYKFTITDDGYAGHYWCEGFNLPDFSQPIGLKVMHKVDVKTSDNYVVLVTVTFNEDEDPLQPQPVPERTVELFKASLRDFFLAVNVRWAGVDSVDKHASTATYILHIWPTASGQGQSDERLAKLQDFIQDKIDVVKTSDVFSSYYCRTYEKSATNLYHWEKTTAGGTAKVFCDDGLVSISRHCLKDNDNDFVQGVRWASITKLCPEDCSDQKQILNDKEINWDIPISTSAEGVLYISTPVCLDKNYGYVTRLKRGDCFDKPAECHSLQNENFADKSLLCPPDFKLYDAIAVTFCYSFTTKVSPYPPKCPFPNNLSPAEVADEVIQILLTEDQPIWYPAKRYSKYGNYTYFLHDGYSTVYRQPVDVKYQIDYGDGKMANKECLILKKNSGKLSLTAVPCEQQYTNICIYTLLQEQRNSYCQLTHRDDKCYHSEYELAKSKCICPKTASQTCSTLAEFLHEYQTFRVSTSADAYKIGMAFDNDKNRYSWSDSNSDLTYSHWSRDLKPKSEVYISHSGWVQKGYNMNWLLCQLEITFNTPSLQLNLDSEAADKFTVILTNPKDIIRSRGGIFCFTDIGANEVVSEITDLQELQTQSEDEIVAYIFDNLHLAGYFWCEAFSYPQFEIIEAHYLVDFYNHYMFYLTIKFQKGEDPTSPVFVKINIIDKLQEIFSDGAFEFVIVTWSRTELIDDVENQATYCLNLKTDKLVDHNEEELKDLEKLLKEKSAIVFKDLLMELTDLLSSYYCPSSPIEELKGHLWPLTIITLKASVECPTDGIFLSRTCEGDFLSGGQWGTVVGTCPIKNYDCEPLPGVINPNVTWNTKISNAKRDASKNYYISTPICLDEFLRPESRICKEGVFQEEPFCEHIQKEINRCPEDFTETKRGDVYFCYRVSDERLPYPPNCPYKNTVSFTEESTKLLMANILYEPVWYPARRYPEFGISYLMVDEPSADYKSDAQASYRDGRISDANCAIRDIDGMIKTVECDSRYKSFCAYLALENDPFASCNIKYPNQSCHDTNFDLKQQTSCHCKNQFKPEDCHMVEMHFPYQNFMIPFNSDIVYMIALCDGAWCSRKPLEYSFWSTKLMLAAPNHYLSFNGWQMKPDNNENVHYLCEKQISYGSSTLSFSETGEKFKVILREQYGVVHKSNFDVMCFTDAVHYDLQVKLDMELKQTFGHVSEYVFINRFPKISGYYWCEAFTYPNVQPITTKKIFFDSGYNNYVIKISSCYKNIDKPLSRNFVEENVNKPLQTELEKIALLHLTVRWMKTLQVDDDIRKVIYLIHLSTQTTENSEKELTSLQNFVKIAVADIPNLKVESRVASSVYCPCEDDLWQQAQCGQTIIASKTCLEANGRLVERTCQGDFTNGCHWNEPTGLCSLINEDDSPITNELFDLLKGNFSNHETITHLIDLTVRNEEFKLIDVFLTAAIYEQILPDCITTSESAKIINNVMNVDPTVLKQSQLNLNSTDKILYHFDYILLHKEPNERQTEELLQEGDVSVLLMDARHSQVNGLSIVAKNHKLIYQYLYKNLTDLTTINGKDLILATHIPKGLIERIISEIEENSFTIRLTVFLKDTMFNEEVSEKQFNGGKNLGILLPTIEETTTFNYAIPIILKPNYGIKEAEEGQCAFWNYGFNTSNKRPIQGSWEKTSRIQVLQHNIRCDFGHTTHFAFLVIDSESDFEKAILENSYFLLIITTIECVLSLLGIIGIFATAILFKTWRRNKGNQILLHLSIVTFFQFGLLYISGAIKESQLIGDDWCFAIGVALHYSVLAQFCWMLVIAYLQYKRFVQVFKRSQSSVVLKSCVVGYILPVLPVLYLVLQERDSYLDKNAGICYPSRDGLTYGVLLPIGCIILINILLFVCIIFSIFFPKSKSNNHFDDDLLMLRFRLVIVLFFVLGMTWIFGILGQMTRNVMFLFLFSLTASLQGFILFMFFIVFNKRSRNLYVLYFKIKRYGA